MELYIYKTNIQTQEILKDLSPLFMRHKEIQRYTVDTEDEDKVLRIEANQQLAEQSFLSDLQTAGYQCEALPY